MENNHTPLPWKIGPTQDTVDDANGVELLVMNVNDYGSDYDATPLPYAANAAFIVRAVNSHAALVEVLRWLDVQGGLGHDKHARIRAAIAKAEEA
jgi:hypothetical protein